MTSDVFSGLVAFGTLALAVATFRVASIGVAENRESYKARLDSNAPRVFVEALELEKLPLASPVAPKFRPAVALVGTPWDVHKYSDTLLGLVVKVRFRNEGQISGIVRIEVPAGPTIRVLGFTVMSDDLTANIESSVTDEMGWSVLPPGVEGMLRFVWWRPTEEWVSDFRSDGDPPTCEVWLIVKDGLGTIKDKCKLIFGASMVGPATVPEGWVLLGASVSEGVADCVGKFEFGEREYLRHGSSGSRWASWLRGRR